MTELNQLILELSSSVMEILAISVAGICLLNTLNSKPTNNPTNRTICGLLKFGNPGVESRPQSSFIACCLGGLHPVRAPVSFKTGCLDGWPSVNTPQKLDSWISLIKTTNLNNPSRLSKKREYHNFRIISFSGHVLP